MIIFVVLDSPPEQVWQNMATSVYDYLLSTYLVQIYYAYYAYGCIASLLAQSSIHTQSSYYTYLCFLPQVAKVGAIGIGSGGSGATLLHFQKSPYQPLRFHLLVMQLKAFYFIPASINTRSLQSYIVASCIQCKTRGGYKQQVINKITSVIFRLLRLIYIKLQWLEKVQLYVYRDARLSAALVHNFCVCKVFYFAL